MKKILKVFIAVLFLCSTAFADNISIESVFNSLTSYKVTSGDFVQEKTAAVLKRPLKSSGSYIICDSGAVWKTLKPFPLTMVVSSTSITQIKPDGTKIITDGSSNEIFKTVAATLSSVFSGSKEELEKFFDIESFNSTESDWEIALKPKDKTVSSALKKIEMSGTVSVAKAALDSIRIIQSETESTSYTFSNQVYRQELTDAEKALFK